MAIIDSLSILLKADTSSFIQGMKKAQKRFSRFTATVKQMARHISVLTAGFLTLFALSARSIFANTFKDADRVGKLSDELGTAVNNIMGLQFAAEQAGTTADVLVRGLQRMNRRIGEAALGYGEGAKALRKFKLRMEEMKDLDATQQFLAITDAVNKLGSQSGKSAQLYALFGRQGQFMINLFQQQRAGIVALINESRRLQGSFDRKEFAIFERMNDDVNRVTKAFRGLTLGLGTEFAEKTIAGLNMLIEALVWIRKNVIPGVSQKLNEFGTAFLKKVQLWGPVIVGVARTLFSIGRMIATVVVSILRIVEDFLVGIVKGIDAMVGGFHRQQGAMMQFGDGVAIVLSQISAVFRVVTEMVKFSVEGILKASEIVSNIDWMDPSSIGKAVEKTVSYFGKTWMDGIKKIPEIYETELVATLGQTEKFQDIIDTILDFNFDLPKIEPSDKTIDVVRALDRFSSANLFGTQGALEVLARGQLIASQMLPPAPAFPAQPGVEAENNQRAERHLSSIDDNIKRLVDSKTPKPGRIL